MHYYHAIDADALFPGVMVPDSRYSETDFLPAYRWAEKQIGFFPLFLAVGDQRAISITGYQNNWRVNVGSHHDDNGKIVATLRKKGQFPNLALLTFRPEDVEAAVFTDYGWWHVILNHCWGAGERAVGKQTLSCLFKRSWPVGRWHGKALRDPSLAQLLAPKLDTTKAQCIWVRNKATQRRLLDRGFTNVVVQRVKVD